MQTKPGTHTSVARFRPRIVHFPSANENPAVGSQVLIASLLLLVPAPDGRADDDTRAILAELVQDAAGRSSLLQNRPSSGYAAGAFTLSSSDDAFALRIRGQIQTRYLAVFRGESDTDASGRSDDPFEPGFELRRAKLFLEGHAWTPALTFQFNGAHRRTNGVMAVEHAWVAYRWDQGLRITAGQFKLPFLREWLVSSSFLLAADRSLTHEAFSLNYSQGVQLDYSASNWRAFAAFSDGARADSTDFIDPKRAVRNGSPTTLIGLGEADYALTARAEIKPFGEWAAFRDFTSLETDEPALMLGLAAHFEGTDQGLQGFSTSTFLYSSWTADLSFEHRGWTIMLAGVGAYSHYEDADTDGLGPNPPSAFHASDHAVVIQTGFRIPASSTELFARYEALFPDDAREASNTSVFDSVTAGLNWYIQGHAAKFTADCSYFFDQQNPLTGARPGIGYLGDDQDGEVMLRLQWQLLF